MITVPYVVDNGQVLVTPSAMVSLVETYLAYKKHVKVRIKLIGEQDEIRKLGIAFDAACKYFGIQNPFHLSTSGRPTPFEEAGPIKDEWVRDFANKHFGTDFGHTFDKDKFYGEWVNSNGGA